MRNSAAPMTMSAEIQQFEQLYQEHLERIYRFVYSHVRNREVAEAQTSHIFLKAVRGLGLERSAHRSTAWLFRVAHTTIADYWRAYYRQAAHSLEELVEAGWEGPVDADLPLVRSRAADRVEDILQTLPERDREVLLHLSVRETALSMGVTETNVAVMQYRALRRAVNSSIRGLSGPGRPRVGLAARSVGSATQPKSSNVSPHPRCPLPAPG